MTDGVVENVITPTLTLFDPTCIDITKVETKFCIYSMKADGVEIVCIGINIYDDDEFMTISSNPDSSYFFKVTSFTLLNDLAGNIVNEIYAGK
jgi:4-hydroxy-3-methylbut-2-enyl diphosphate reductase IspH